MVPGAMFYNTVSTSLSHPQLSRNLRTKPTSLTCPPFFGAFCQHSRPPQIDGPEGCLSAPVPSPGPDSVLQGTGSQPLPPKAWFRVNSQSWPAKKSTHKRNNHAPATGRTLFGVFRLNGSQLSRMTCAIAPQKAGPRSV